MKFALLFFLATACGPVNVDAKGNAAVPAAVDTKPKAVDVTPSAPTAVEEPAPAAEEPKADPAPAAGATAAATVTASCTAPVAPKAAEAPRPVVPAPGHSQQVYYGPKVSTWTEAHDHPPAGMRLASRAEVLELVDSGFFDGTKYPAGDLGVWTATALDHKRDAVTAHYAVGLDSNPATMSLDDTTKLPAVYVDGPW